MCDTFDPQYLKNLLVSAAGEKEKFDPVRTTTSFKKGQIASRVCAHAGEMDVSENIYANPSLCVLAHINAGVICAFSRIGSPPPHSHSPPGAQFTSPYCHRRMSPPWSNFLSAIIWCVRTVSHWQVRRTLGLGMSWLLNAGLAPNQTPVCLDPTVPTGLDTWGWLLGQLATEGCNQSLWHIWHQLRWPVWAFLPNPFSPEDGNVEAGDPYMKQSQSNKRPRKEEENGNNNTLWRNCALTWCHWCFI